MNTSLPALLRLLGILWLSTVHGQLHEGEQCRLNNGSRGVCRSVPACPGEEIIQGSLPQVCSVVNNSPILCCADGGGLTKRSANGQTTPTPTTKQSASPHRMVDETTLAGRKCMEYARTDIWDKESPALSMTQKVFNISKCVMNVETLIVGKVEAEAKEFPHMAGLGFGADRNNIKWMCGGSLISEKYVLTAAHCLSARGVGPVNWVRLGDHNIKSAADDANAVTIAVVERIRHDSYKPPAHYNDIALLKLETDVVFSPYIRPACLYTRQGNPPNLNNATAIGWGKIEYTDDVGSDKLMKVILALQDPSRCNHTYLRLIQSGTRLRTGINPDSMICAGDPRGGDTCGGDAGGPLQIRLHDPDPMCMYSIIGLTSFGVYECGRGDNPAVYTRVSNYIPWIERIVWA